MTTKFAMTFERVAGPFEGPTAGLAWDGEAMLFSVMALPGRILRFHPATGETSVFRTHTMRTNGLGFGPDGALYGAQESSRRVVRFMPDGTTVLTEPQIDGRYHNQPTKLAVDARGRVWFADPHSALRSFGPQFLPYLDHASVLRLERDPQRKLWEIRRMTYDTASPRAVALAPDGKTLYVAETDNRPDGNRELRAYPIDADEMLGPPRVLHVFGRDYRGPHRGIEGMCCDAEGNVVAVAGWAKSGPGALVYVFAPSGAVIESHVLPMDRPTNCAFGDASMDSLYVTTESGELYRAKGCGRRGLHWKR
jgi:gluconolactonase